jgi:hypothetical protein
VKRPAPNDPVETRLVITQAIADDLDLLVAMGIFGFSREDAMERLLAEKIRELHAAGWLDGKRIAPLRKGRGR